MRGRTITSWRGPDLAFLEVGGVRLMLSTPQGAGELGRNSILYFAVSDMLSAHAGLLARGAIEERSPQLAAKMPEHELWTGFLRDPDGNLIGLMEEKRGASGSPGWSVTLRASLRRLREGKTDRTTRAALQLPMHRPREAHEILPRERIAREELVREL